MLGFKNQKELEQNNSHRFVVSICLFLGLLLKWIAELPTTNLSNVIFFVFFVILPVCATFSYLLYCNMMFIINFVLPRNIALQHAGNCWQENKKSILGCIERLDFTIINAHDKILLSTTNDVQIASAILVKVWDNTFEKELQIRIYS